ncbi:MAG: hypothetical protein QF473_29395, partial [Planctomycetota bacterium]|nr:hypothetical protein [Planctomycetota bacterium]
EELAASTSSSELSHFAGNRIDLERHFDTPENVSAYLFRRFKTGRGSIVRLFAGCDEGLRVWLNGKPVVRMRSSKLKYDAQAFEAKTKTGGNSLLVEVSNIKGEWEFCLRMEDQTGRPIAISPSGNLVVVE